MADSITDIVIPTLREIQADVAAQGKGQAELRQSVEALTTEVRQGFKLMDIRLGLIEQRLLAQEHTDKVVAERIDALEARVRQLENKVSN
ncbi:MAG: hypothetical protein ACR2RB_15610 [Gammaproteobacteria bacterium]